MEVTLRDLDEDYASLPEPPAGSAPSQFPDTYLGGYGFEKKNPSTLDLLLVYVFLT